MRVDSVPTVHVFVSSNYICMCKCLLRKAAASALAFSLVFFPREYICFHADVAGILRGILRGNLEMKFLYILMLSFCKRLRFERDVSVIRGPSHACAKRGASFP